MILMSLIDWWISRTLKCLDHQVKVHDVRLPAGVVQGLIAHLLPLAKLRKSG